MQQRSFPEQINLLRDYNLLEEFKKDILIGLSKRNKLIPSKYFYDKNGSLLFNKITKHPDYYLTNCELEILAKQKKYFSKLFGKSVFNLIELGPGEGIKTLELFDQLVFDSLDFIYSPIDISTEYLTSLRETLSQEIPALKVQPINSDFFDGLKWLSIETDRRNVVLFLGSSIGNFDINTTKRFIKNMWSVLNHNDYVLIGFDLKKDISILMKAYNDSDGLTTKFNLNLLDRMNNELGANFNKDYFIHYETYNPSLGAMESYLLSTTSQIVRIKAINKVFYFDEYEAIHVENSFKYTVQQIENFVNTSQFKLIGIFADQKQYFVDVLWQVIKKP